MDERWDPVSAGGWEDGVRPVYTRESMADRRKRLEEQGSWEAFQREAESSRWRSDGSRLPKDARKRAFWKVVARYSSDEDLAACYGWDWVHRQKGDPVSEAAGRGEGDGGVLPAGVAGLEQVEQSPAQNVMWVARHLDVDVKVQDAPNTESWSLLKWARGSAENRATFWNSIYMKASQDRSKDRRQFADDGGSVLALIDRLEKAGYGARRG